MGGARFSFYPCVIGVSFLYSLGSSSMVMLGFLLVPQSLAAVWWICRLARSKSISISKRTGIWCSCKSDPFRALDRQKPSEKRCLQRAGGKAVRHPHRTVLPCLGRGWISDSAADFDMSWNARDGCTDLFRPLLPESDLYSQGAS